jgi:hypothetical protein
MSQEGQIVQRSVLASASGKCLSVTRRDFLRTAAGATVAAASGGGVWAWPRGASAAEPVWVSVPDQNWVVGQPVNVDLNDYVTDGDGDPLTFSLDEPLPDGVTLNPSTGVISGTPTGVFGPTQFVATADDGTGDSTPPSAPTGLVVK